MTKGKIITFYSYKGGVGRTMSLANIATVLALWNKKVLIIDWDLEAPGLEKYFSSYTNNTKLGSKSGVIDLLLDKTSGNKVNWKRYLQNINISNKYNLKYFGSGKKDGNYFSKIKQLDIDSLYEKNFGFEFFEKLRNEWKSEFDFILIDSRTGITDIGGICTIQLPDIVLVFTNTNEQSLLGTKEIIERINSAQQSQPYDRQNLIIFPVLCRFDTTTEFEISQVWIKKISDTLKNIYNDWLPLTVERKEFIEKTKIPYFPYFSFGEKLSVIEQGFSDPASMGYAYESIASIIVNNFENIDAFIKNRNKYISLASKSYNLSSLIKIVGVGGGGNNAVNHMYRKGIKDVDFVACNTDAQALSNSPISAKIQLGSNLTEGRGAGNKPDIGRNAAIEAIDNLNEVLSNNTKMIIIIAGMGGGTGTGAAPIIAKAAKELGILTIAIVTIPFRNEGKRRTNQAIEGILEIEKYVDSLLIVNNERIRGSHGDLSISEVFSLGDEILSTAAKGIAEIITVQGYINIDFADIYEIMNNSGFSIMGLGAAKGNGRALKAIETALSSPLMNNIDLKGARNILLSISSGSKKELLMDEIGIITDYVQNKIDSEATILWGSGIDESLENSISITLIATGFKDNLRDILTIDKLLGDSIDKTPTIQLDEIKKEEKRQSNKKL